MQKLDELQKEMTGLYHFLSETQKYRNEKLRQSVDELIPWLRKYNWVVDRIREGTVHRIDLMGYRVLKARRAEGGSDTKECIAVIQQLNEMRPHWKFMRAQARPTLDGLNSLYAQGGRYKTNLKFAYEIRYIDRLVRVHQLIEELEHLKRHGKNTPKNPERFARVWDGKVHELIALISHQIPMQLMAHPKIDLKVTLDDVGLIQTVADSNFTIDVTKVPVTIPL